MEEARKCLLEGADYIGFGPVYPTTSKKTPAQRAGLAPETKSWRRSLCPSFAIGGITKDNMPLVIQAGVYVLP